MFGIDEFIAFFVGDNTLHLPAQVCINSQVEVGAQRIAGQGNAVPLIYLCRHFEDNAV